MFLACTILWTQSPVMSNNVSISHEWKKLLTYVNNAFLWRSEAARSRRTRKVYSHAFKGFSKVSPSKVSLRSLKVLLQVLSSTRNPAWVKSFCERNLQRKTLVWESSCTTNWSQSKLSWALKVMCEATATYMAKAFNGKYNESQPQLTRWKRSIVKPANHICSRCFFFTSTQLPRIPATCENSKVYILR